MKNAAYNLEVLSQQAKECSTVKACTQAFSAHRYPPPYNAITSRRDGSGALDTYVCSKHVCVCVCLCVCVCVAIPEIALGKTRVALLARCLNTQGMGVHVCWSPIKEHTSHMQCKRTCRQFLDAVVHSCFATHWARTLSPGRRHD